MNIGGDKKRYLDDEVVVDCVLSLEFNGEFVEDNDELAESRRGGKDVYIKYGNAAVGESIGSIFQCNNQYMYYSFNKQMVTALTDDQLELLQEYL